MILLEFQASQLARATDDVAGTLLGLKADLYQEPVDITPATPLATFTAVIANYTGYAQGAVTWEVPSVADDGTVEVIGNFAVWRPTDAVTPNNIWGIFFRAAIGGALLFAGQFDGAPLPMANALQQIAITLRYRPATNSVVVTVS